MLMKIKHEFNYEADWDEIADEFTANDSAYQAQILNRIGDTFKRWTRSKTQATTYIQLLEIAEDLDDDGKWFINILHDYMQGVNTDE
jgi:hypothetical protein